MPLLLHTAFSTVCREIKIMTKKNTHLDCESPIVENPKADCANYAAPIDAQHDTCCRAITYQSIIPKVGMIPEFCHGLKMLWPERFGLPRAITGTEDYLAPSQGCPHVRCANAVQPSSSERKGSRRSQIKREKVYFGALIQFFALHRPRGSSLAPSLSATCVL